MNIKERQERKSEIFQRRRKNFSNVGTNAQSIEYRVLEQRPVVEAEVIPTKEPKPKRKPSSNKFCPHR
jgi:hypothetical protein